MYLHVTPNCIILHTHKSLNYLSSVFLISKCLPLQAQMYFHRVFFFLPEFVSLFYLKTPWILKNYTLILTLLLPVQFSAPHSTSWNAAIPYPHAPSLSGARGAAGLGSPPRRRGTTEAKQQNHRGENKNQGEPLPARAWAHVVQMKRYACRFILRGGWGFHC